MADRDDFFIGWARPSWRTVGFLGVISVMLLVLFAGTSAVITQLQSSPGASKRQWGVEYTGIYYLEPYGHLVVPTDDGPSTVLLSSGNKAGVQGFYKEKVGTPVTIRGLAMDRDGRRFLEVGGAFQDAELDETDLAAIERLEWTNLGAIELSGEIVDSKCYFGRMRPGSGKGHRACAQLCVRGGVPPVLVTRAPDGRRTHVVVTGPGRTDIHTEIVEYVGEPIRATGTLWRRADLFAIELDPSASITRLWPELR